MSQTRVMVSMGKGSELRLEESDKAMIAFRSWTCSAFSMLSLE